MSAIFQQPVGKNDRLLVLVFSLLGAGMILGAFLLSWLASLPVLQEVWQRWPLPPVCMFRNLTELPCPSCGMTRAMIEIARGDLAAAIRYNILSVPLFAGTLAFVAAGVIRPGLSLAVLKSLGNIRGIVLIVILLLTAWAVKLTGPPAYW